MRINLLCIITFLSLYGTAQHRFIGSVHRDSSDLFSNYDSPIIATNEGVIVRTNNLSAITRINADAETKEILYFSGGARIDNITPAGAAGLFFTEYDFETSTAFIRLLKPDGSSVQLATATGDYLPIYDLSVTESGVFFRTLSGGSSALSRINLPSLTVDLLWTGAAQPWFHGSYKKGVLYSVPGAAGTFNLLDIQEGNAVTVMNYSSGTGAIQPGSTIEQSNDAENVYVYISTASGTGNTWKYSPVSGNILRFSSEQTHGLFYTGNDEAIFVPHYTSFVLSRAHITADTINSVDPIFLGSEWKAHYFDFRPFPFPSPFGIVQSDNNGVEIGTVLNEDSVRIFNDLTPGFRSSIPLESCVEMGSPLIQGTIFQHEDRIYTVQTNAKDSYFYLYELTESSSESRFRLEDFFPHSRLAITDERIYWMNYDAATKRYSFYSKTWESEQLQQPAAILPSEEWFNQLAFKTEQVDCSYYNHNYYISGIEKDDEGNYFVSFIDWTLYASVEKAGFADIRSGEEVISKATVAYAKYNRTGELQWISAHGGEDKAYGRYDKMVILPSGDLRVFSSYGAAAWFNSDSTYFEGTKYYTGTINKETGAFENFRILSEHVFIDVLKYREIVSDSQGNTYVAFSYSGYSTTIGDTTLYSDFDSQNALMKTDAEGNVLWVRNVLSSPTDYISAIHSMALNDDETLIALSVEQEGEFFCSPIGWQNELIVYDTAGPEKQRVRIYGDRQNGESSIFFTRDDQLMVKGTFRGNIQAGMYESQSQPVGDCYAPKAYSLKYDLDKELFTEGLTSPDNSVISAIETKKINDTLYVLGVRSQTSELVLERFDNDGNYQGELGLGQFKNTVSWDHHFEYSNGYVTIIGRQTTGLQENGFLPFYGEYEPVSVYRMKADQWEMRNDAFPMQVKRIAENEEFSVFPNPSDDKFNVYFNNPGVVCVYSVFTTDGKIIAKGEAQTSTYLQLDLSGKSAGFYYLSLEINGERYETPIVRY